MREKRLIAKMRAVAAIGLIGLISLMGLMGCSDDYQEEKVQKRIRIELQPLVQQYEEAQPEPITRAWTPPSGYVKFNELSYTAGKNFSDRSIGVFLTRDAVQEGETVEAKILSGVFAYYDDEWYTDFEIAKEDDYYLYGYYPAIAGATAITPDATTGSFADGAKLTLYRMPTLTTTDVCVIVGAREGTASDVNSPFYPGWFKYHANPALEPADPLSPPPPAANYVYLLFDHLYAVLNIQMRVDVDYDALRTIKLKKLSLKTSADDAVTTRLMTAEVTLKATGGSNPIYGDIVFTPDPSSGEGDDSFFSSSEGLLLTTSYSNYIGHFMPHNINTLYLTSTYDVYDKKGNLIRKNSTATNKLPIGLFDAQTSAHRGKIYTIQLTVQPTYLYMLSDQDIDSPTVTF